LKRRRACGGGGGGLENTRTKGSEDAGLGTERRNIKGRRMMREAKDEAMTLIRTKYVHHAVRARTSSGV
jgi:hypothetical protein